MAPNAVIIGLMAFTCCASGLKQNSVLASLGDGIKHTAKVVYTDSIPEHEDLQPSLIQIFQKPNKKKDDKKKPAPKSVAAVKGDGDVDTSLSAADIDLPAGYKAERRPPNKTPEGTVLMKSRIDVHTCYGIDDAAGLIKFSSKITSFWVDARLKVDNAPDVFTRIDADKIWHPRWSFLNTASLDQEMTTTKVNWFSGKVKMQYISTQSISSDIDFKKFPFDSHNFKIGATAVRYGMEELHNSELTASDLLAAGEDSPSNAALDGATWKVTGVKTAVVHKATLFSPKDELLQVEMLVTRKRLNPLVCGCLPQLLIVLFQLGAFVIGPLNFGDQVSVTITGVFTIVLFFGIVDGYFPRIAYLSWMHWYTFVCNVLTFGIFFAVLAINYFYVTEVKVKDEDDKTVKQVDAEGKEVPLKRQPEALAELEPARVVNRQVGWAFVIATIVSHIVLLGGAYV